MEKLYSSKALLKMAGGRDESPHPPPPGSASGVKGVNVGTIKPGRTKHRKGLKHRKERQRTY